MEKLEERTNQRQTTIYSKPSKIGGLSPNVRYRGQTTICSGSSYISGPFPNGVSRSN